MSRRSALLLLLLAVGAGVTEGEFVNRAQALSGLTGNAMSGEATAIPKAGASTDMPCRIPPISATNAARNFGVRPSTGT